MQKTNLDIISINKLVVPCLIGTYDHERKGKQIVIISIRLFVDTTKAGKSDDLRDTVNYHDIAQSIYEIAHTSSFALLEKLAQVIAADCLKNKLIKRVTVSIEKPKALSLAASAAIEITRNNETE